MTARTYLGYIAEQAGGFAIIGRDGKLYIRTIGEDTTELALRYFSEYSWGERFKVSRIAYEDGVQDFKKGNEVNNTIWISSDNMYIVDQEQIDNIYNEYQDFEVYSFSGTSIVDPAWDMGDIITIDNRKIVYQGELEYKGKFKASISSDIQAKSKEETTATKISETTKIRRVQSQIDQVEGTITQLVQETDEFQNQLSQVEQTVDQIQQQVSDTIVYKREVEGVTEIHLEDAGEADILELEIQGNKTYESNLYPGENVFPSESLQPNMETRDLVYKIIVDKQPSSNPSSEKKEYIVDIEELRVKGDVYDSLNIEMDRTYVTRRLSLSEYGVLSVLDKPVIQELTDVDIKLFKGDNYIYLMDMQGNKFYAEYLIKNDFTDLYVTTNQMTSAIRETATNIELFVSQTLEGYSTTEEMYSAINLSSSTIMIEVNKKVNDEDLTGANITLRINNDTSEATINADKISLAGKKLT